MPLRYYENNPWESAAAQTGNLNNGISGLFGNLAAMQMQRQQFADQMALRRMELDMQNRLYQSHEGLYNAQTAGSLLKNQQEQQNLDWARNVQRATWAQNQPLPSIGTNVGEPSMENAARLAPADLRSSLMGIAAMSPGSAERMMLHNVPPGNTATDVTGRLIMDNPQPWNIPQGATALIPGQENPVYGMAAVPSGNLLVRPQAGGPTEVLSDNPKNPAAVNAGAMAAFVRALSEGYLRPGELGQKFGTNNVAPLLQSALNALGVSGQPEVPVAQPEPSIIPKPGTVYKGYRFKGGDPALQANWEKVK
jgi:hypothetical protein